MAVRLIGVVGASEDERKGGKRSSVTIGISWMCRLQQAPSQDHAVSLDCAQPSEAIIVVEKSEAKL